MTARSRLRLDLVGALYLARLGFAALIALPLASALVSPGVSALPAGDAALFAPGGLYLVETLRLALPALTSALPVAGWLLALASVLGALPVGALLFAAHHPEEGVLRCMQRALGHLPRLLLLGGIGLLGQALILVFATVGAGGLRSALTAGSGAPVGDFAALAVVLLGIGSAAVMGLWCDLARASSIAHPLGVAQCWQHALRCARTRPATVLIAYCAPVSLVLAAGIAVGFAVGALSIEQGAAWRWQLALVLHQGVMFASCLGEGFWQRWAAEIASNPLHTALERRVY